MDRVKRAFKGMGMRWRPAALGPAWGRAGECFMSICLLEMHSSDYDSALQSNRTHLLETFTHPSFSLESIHLALRDHVDDQN